LTTQLNKQYNALGFDMKGIRAEGKCPKCGNPFKWAGERKGFICKKHLITAQRFSVIIFHGGERIVRGTTLDGKTLDTFAAASALRTQAENEKQAKRFNPDRWKSKKKIEYAFSFLIDKWYRRKEELMETDKRAPSYVPKLDTYIRLYFLPCYGDTDVREIFNFDVFEEMLPTFRTHDKREAQLSLKYQKNLTDALKGFFRWLETRKYISDLPAFPEAIEVPEHEPLTISKETQLGILGCVPEEHKPIFTWLFHQGCRPEEARALKWDCIRGDEVCYKRGFSAGKPKNHTKTKNIRYNFIYPETLEGLPQRGLPTSYVFTHGQIVRRYYSEAYLNRIYNKALAEFNEKYGTELCIGLYEATKHSFGTQMVNEEEMPLDLVQKWFGHTKRETTERYAKLKVVDAFRKRHNVVLLRKAENEGLTGGRQ
jgi:integrase